MRTSFISTIGVSLGIFAAVSLSLPNGISDEHVNSLNVRKPTDWGAVNWNAVNYDGVNWAGMDWDSIFNKPTPTPKPSKPKPTSKPKPKPTSKPKPKNPDNSESKPKPHSKPSKPASKLKASQKLWGVAYSPFNNDGSYAGVGTVTADLKKAAKITSNIRLYATDKTQLGVVMQAIKQSKIPLGIHAGIWIQNGKAAMQDELNGFVSAVKKYGKGMIKGVSVGNEDITSGVSEDTLIGYIKEVRARLRKEGLGSIPVYTTQQDGIFTKRMAEVSDLIQVNIQTIFDKSFTSIDASAKSVLARARSVKNSVAGGKPVRIGEVGWASSGNTGPAPLNVKNLAAFAKRFRCIAAGSGFGYFYFEFKDALWKKKIISKNLPSRELHFGLHGPSGKPKFNLKSLNSC
ncbi:hypothetical protein H4S08_002147 [Coemansia sp. RSA 1365]|nr:hypothetical protein H4S08_002147 [Coemansia sp. RSA 1365]